MRALDIYSGNLRVLERAYKQNRENEFIVSGIIDKFFVQFELGWKMLKELLVYEGVAAAASGSPRAIVKEAYKIYDFIDAEVWLEMLEQRNDLTHIYDGGRAKELAEKVINRYVTEFQKVEKAIKNLYMG